MNDQEMLVTVDIDKELAETIIQHKGSVYLTEDNATALQHLLNLKDDDVKEISRIEKYLRKNEDFERTIWQLLEVNTYSELETHTPFVDEIKVTDEDRKEFEQSVANNLKPFRWMYLHLDHPNKNSEMRLVEWVNKWDLWIILAWMNLDHQTIDDLLWDWFFARNKVFWCQCELRSDKLIFELKAAWEDISVEVEIPIDDEKIIQLIKYLGPEERDLREIMGLISFSIDDKE